MIGNDFKLNRRLTENVWHNKEQPKKNVEKFPEYILLNDNVRVRIHCWFDKTLHSFCWVHRVLPTVSNTIKRIFPPAMQSIYVVLCGPSEIIDYTVRSTQSKYTIFEQFVASYICKIQPCQVNPILNKISRFLSFLIVAPTVRFK